MKTLRILTIIGIILALPVIFFSLVNWWEGLPRPSFKRHFGSPIPKSVVIEEKWGYTGLAGSSEYILFTIAKNDLETIIDSLDMKKCDIQNSNVDNNNINRGIVTSEFQQEIAIAKKHGLPPVGAFITDDQYGLTYHLILIDSNGTRVLYHYFKT